MSYFHMENNHTIIGAERFHFWVRDGIRWYPFAKVTKQTVFLWIPAFTGMTEGKKF